MQRPGSPRTHSARIPLEYVPSPSTFGRLSAAVLGAAWLALAALVPVSTAAATSTRPPVVAIEFYHSGLDHYFVTANPVEIQALNSGQFSGWIATGFSFPVFSADQAIDGSSPVCRFYGLPEAGLDSHFYSASPSECEEVRRKFASSWLLESGDVFRVFAADAATGACPSDTEPVRRLYNGRADANHRYTDLDEVALSMIPKGYVAEGYGGEGLPTAFCVPKAAKAINCTATASDTQPVNGTTVTLTANCTGNPTSYEWIGCASGGGNTCTATSTTAGGRAYVVTASNENATGRSAIVSVVWQAGAGALAPAPAVPVSCTLSASSLNPVAGEPLALKANCTGSPSRYTWTKCSSVGSTCTAQAVAPGAVTYSVSASNGTYTSVTTSIVATWKAATLLSCTLAASTPLPQVNTSVTLTATCNGTASSYAWTGCPSTTSTCTTASAVAGARTYSVTATNAAGVSVPAATTVTWQTTAPTPTPAPSAVSCTLTPSSANPVVNTPVTLTASCTGNPSSYTWRGCNSSTASCSATSGNPGIVVYSVVAASATSTSAAANASVSWQTAPPAPAGMPTSADFVALASDPRGGSNGYNTFKRLPDGRGVSFGGFSHDPRGNNAVAVYNPSNNAWQIVVAHTPWIDGPMVGVAMDVRGRSYLGNRDNHLSHVVGNELWISSGERGISLTGNNSGRLDLSAWRWSVDDSEAFAGGPWTPQIGVAHWINSAAGTLPDGTLYVFGGDRASNPWDGLWLREPGGKIREYWNIWNNPAFAGAEKLRYISNSHFVRNSKILVYGGSHEFRSALLGREAGRTLYQIDPTVPSMAAISVNPLPQGQRVEGSAIFAYHVPEKDMMVATDGQLVNVYDFATGTWMYVPTNTIPDSDRTLRMAGFYSPEVAMGIALYLKAKTFGLRLNYGGAPTPAPSPSPASISCTLQTSNSTALVGSSVTLRAACSGSPTTYSWTRCSSSSSVCMATASAAGSVTYFVTASNATNTSNAASTTVLWQASPVATPPPPVGSLSLRATAVPYVGASRALGSSKHLDFARFGNRWYKMAGDHAKIDGNTPDPQDGRQEILSVSFAANDWRQEQTFFLRSGGSQIALPDDAFAMVRAGEIWSFVSERVDQSSTAARTAAMRAAHGADIATQEMDAIGAWNPSSGTWRTIMPRPKELRGNRAWRGTYDSINDRFVIPVYSNELVWLLIGGDGTDRTSRYPSGNPVEYGSHDFHAAGIVGDEASRTRYVYDHRRGEVWSVNLDTLSLVRLAVIPETYSSGQAGIQIVWHPTLRAVVISAKQLYAYEVDTGKLTTWTRPDGFTNGVGTYVPPSTMLYDPDTGDVISVGGIDWDTGMRSAVYWRLAITR